MRHTVLERWSRRESPLHRLDARAKILALLVFLVSVSTAPSLGPAVAGGFAALCLAAAAVARLPLWAVMAKAAIVLPFTVTFASVSWLAGDPGRAVSLVVKSYLSALAVLVVVASTPLPALLTGMELLGAPRFLVLVVQFLYRYLFVIAGQAAGMRVASVSRASQSAGGRRRGFRAAAGALSVLFARSYARAEGVHRAMLARAFDRHFPLLSPSRWRAADGFFLAAAIMAAAGLRYAAGR